MDKQRILYISIFVVVTIGLGFAIYRVFFYTPKPVTQVPPTQQIPGSEFPQAGTAEPSERPAAEEPSELPDSVTVPVPTTPTPTVPGTTQPTSRIQTVVDVSLTNPDAGGTTKTPRFYNEEDGKFYKLGNNGDIQKMSDEVFFNVQEVTWSPTNDESIIEYPDGANIYYNFSTDEQVTLPKHWDSFSFTKTGDKIAAKSLGFSPENRWLVSSDPKGNNIQLIEPLGNNADKVIVDWSPNKQVVALATTGQSYGADRQEVLFVGQHGENFKSTIVEGRDLRTEWSDTGTKLLYSVHNARNDFKPELWVVNGQGDAIGSGRKLLNIDTWADKCTFVDDRFVFCGVPQTLERGSGFAPTLADNTPDDIYKIDVDTGLKIKIPVEEFHVIDSIMVSDDGKELYITDKNIPGLFKVAL